MRLFRVLPYVSSAAENEPGGVFFRPPTGKNRADAPDGSYACLYVGDTPEGAIAEAFGRFDMWDEALFAADPATPLVPGSRFTLVSYELSDAAQVRDLDNAQTLLDEHLRPSEVVTRDRTTTQAWAGRIHVRGTYQGVRWWSYYDAGWHSVALWDLVHLSTVGRPRILSVHDAHVQQSALTIVRRLVR
jgi:RES domain